MSIDFWSRVGNVTSIMLTFSIVWIIVAAVTALLAWRASRKRSSRILRVVVWIASILLIAGTCLSYFEYLKLEYYITAASWPTTQGKVIKSVVAGERAFRPEISIEYEAGGMMHTITTNLDVAGFGTRNNRLDAAEKLVVEYPVGREVMVHYNPFDPDIARLQSTPPFAVLIQFAFGVSITLLGMVGVLSCLMQQRNLASQ